jgi:hypothetical protein
MCNPDGLPACGLDLEEKDYFNNGYLRAFGTYLSQQKNLLSNLQKILPSVPGKKVPSELVKNLLSITRKNYPSELQKKVLDICTLLQRGFAAFPCNQPYPCPCAWLGIWNTRP